MNNLTVAEYVELVAPQLAEAQAEYISAVLGLTPEQRQAFQATSARLQREMMGQIILTTEHDHGAAE